METTTSLSELLKEKWIEKKRTPVDEQTVKRLLEQAEKKLKAAEDVMKIDHAELALESAYNAMLLAGMALLEQREYVVKAQEHHYAVVRFCAALMPSETGTLVKAFNIYRTRRNDIIYGEIVNVSKDEAKHAIEKAKEFVEKIKAMAK